MPDTAPAGAGSTTAGAVRRRSGRGASIAIAGVLVLLLILGGGTAAAAFIPLYSATAQKSLGEMLPATTVFYVSADLNPSGATKDNLNRIEKAFTGQPGWSKTSVVSQYNQGSQRHTSSASCYRDTQRQVTARLSDLGHESALALTDTKGINLSGVNGANAAGSATSQLNAFKQNLVVVAPINAKRTLFQVLTGSGLSFSLPQKTSVYNGTTIYAETLTSCGQASGGAAQTVYAASIKNCVLLGLVPQALYAIIDTASGRRPNLASTTSYQQLMAKLPGDHLGSYYLNGKSLSDIGVFSALKNLPNSAQVPSSAYASVQKPTAAALSVDQHGFIFTAAALNSGAGNAQSAGALAASLPSDIEALFSIQGLKQNIDQGVKQLEQSGLLNTQLMKEVNPFLTDLTTDLSGEADVVVFHPTTQISQSNPASIPLALLWQVGDETSATNHLNDLATRLGVASQLKTGTASDGTTYHVYKGSIGYAVRKGWAIVALDIGKTIDALSSKPAQSLATVSSYQRAIPAGSTPSTTWYFDITGLRTSLEASLLPTQSPQQQANYNTNFKPFIAPIQTIAGSVGTTAAVGYSTIIVDIGP